MKKLLFKKIGRNGRSLTVSLHKEQLDCLDVGYDDIVKVYVKGKKIIIEKKED